MASAAAPPSSPVPDAPRLSAPSAAASQVPALAWLEDACRTHGLVDAAARLSEVHTLLRDDLDAVDSVLRGVAPHPELGVYADPARASAAQLAAAPGKRLRAACVLAAARLGDTTHSGHARALALAVELVHAATLLHDDVIDQGEVRRGRPTARVVFGNAVAVLGGDWLLVRALVQVRRAERPALVDRLLAVLERMLVAESRQLARTTLLPSRSEYLELAEGKTASLFEWALEAGGCVAELDAGALAGLRTFGRGVGLAFQLADDALDLSGDASVLGKAALQDLRDGKTGYPLILAAERAPQLVALLEDARRVDGAMPKELTRAILEIVAQTGAVEATLAFANEHAREATAALEALPNAPTRAALCAIAHAAAHRSS